MLTLLAELKHHQLISELNYQFAKLIDRKQQACQYNDQQKNLAVLLAALMSFYTQQGHSCLRLDSALANNLFGLNSRSATQPYHQAILQKIGEIRPLDWQACLSGHIAFSQDPTQIAPLLFQHERLYFYRYWQAENRIATRLQQAAQNAQKNVNPALDKQILDRFFEPKAEIDWQKIAVATALNKPFALISGGPGTGKTRTVAILLAALQLKQLELGLPPLNTALAAPTGKAAARLKESITANLQQLALPESLKQLVPTQASTIHTLLGIRPNSDTPKHHSNNPLPYDLLVVDEASMIDLFVMEKLCNAISPTTRLIMLGDKDQLASVEAGNTMSELGELLTLGYSEAHSHYLRETSGYPIFSQSDNVPPICDSLCHLRHSYRFDEHSGIGEVAKRINARQAVDAWRIFTEGQFADLSLQRYPEVQHFNDKQAWIQQCVTQVVDIAVPLYREYLNLVKARIQSPDTVSVRDIFAAFQKVRFLCALRVSELGVERLNQRIAEALRQARLVEFVQSRESYVGKPIMITENAPQHHIFNGDIGLILPDEAGKLRCYFESQTENGQYLRISPSRLPNNEPAYVMTVHKSQGSEFEHTFLVMPLSSAPILTKELLYTAVTRAKKHFTLFGEEKVWKNAVKTEISRQSGLKIQLFSQQDNNIQYKADLAHIFSDEKGLQSNRHLF